MESLKRIYKNMRTQGSYPIEWFHSYYSKKANKPIDLQTFQFVFRNVNLDSLISSLDYEFELTILTNKENKIILCY